jgi:hypothetical protein
MSRLKNKKGGTMVLLVILLVILFPVLVCSIIDISNIYKISKRTKVSLNAAVKSASSRINWKLVPDGLLLIDEDKAMIAFLDVMNENLDIELNSSEDYYSSSSTKTVRCYVSIYNNRHHGSYDQYPPAGEIPEEVTDKEIRIRVDRPTVFAVATVEYKLSPLFGGRVLKITEYASSQLNQKEDPT